MQPARHTCVHLFAHMQVQVRMGECVKWIIKRILTQGSVVREFSEVAWNINRWLDCRFSQRGVPTYWKVPEIDLFSLNFVRFCQWTSGFYFYYRMYGNRIVILLWVSYWIFSSLGCNIIHGIALSDVLWVLIRNVTVFMINSVVTESNYTNQPFANMINM